MSLILTSKKKITIIIIIIIITQPQTQTTKLKTGGFTLQLHGTKQKIICYYLTTTASKIKSKRARDIEDECKGRQVISLI